MPKKYSCTIYGIIIGFLLGCIAGIGETTHYKKSERKDLTPVFSIVGGIIFCFVGAYFGYNIGEALDIEEATGIGDCQTNYFKIGRYWNGITSWIDPRDNKKYNITTGKISQGVIISRFNKLLLIRHNTISASRQSIEKYHSGIVRISFSKIKKAYKRNKSVPPFFVLFKGRS